MYVAIPASASVLSTRDTVFKLMPFCMWSSTPWSPDSIPSLSITQPERLRDSQKERSANSSSILAKPYHGISGGASDNDFIRDRLTALSSKWRSTGLVFPYRQLMSAISLRACSAGIDRYEFPSALSGQNEHLHQ